VAEQRALGMSMRVERSTLEEVQLRFDANKRAKEVQAQAQPSFEARVAWATEEEEAQRAARKLRKLEKKVRLRSSACVPSCHAHLTSRNPMPPCPVLRRRRSPLRRLASRGAASTRKWPP
jgi:hypothetical protein